MAANAKGFDGLFMQNGRYKYEFNEKEPIGRGSYGVVFKAQNKMDDKFYAIKKIKITSTVDFTRKIKEIKVWAKLDCDYFVQYRSSWVESYDAELIKNYKDSIQMDTDTSIYTEDVVDVHNDMTFHILYIQMDLCLFTLKDAMNIILSKYKIPKGQILNIIGYYIASELFTEILESINYLHKQSIIHRDLKPQNILISNGANGRFIKIADFGIAIEHEVSGASHTQLRGTLKYMAPEVINSRKYDTKVDIYSLGVIMQEMFNVDFNKRPYSDDSILENKYKEVFNIIIQTLSVRRSERPNCEHILSIKKLWSLEEKDIKGVMKGISQHKLYPFDDPFDDFVSYFLQRKKLNYLSFDEVLVFNEVSVFDKIYDEVVDKVFDKVSDELFDEVFDEIFEEIDRKYKIEDNKAITSRNDISETNKSQWESQDISYFSIINLIGKFKLLKMKTKQNNEQCLIAIRNSLKKDNDYLEFNNFNNNNIVKWQEMLLKELTLNYDIIDKDDDEILSFLSSILTSDFIIDTGLVYSYFKTENFLFSLENLLEISQEEPYNTKLKMLTPFKYYIACELFKEILIAFNYLNDQNLLIYLETANILITEENCGNYVKICDLNIYRNKTNIKEQSSVESIFNMIIYLFQNRRS